MPATAHLEVLEPDVVVIRVDGEFDLATSRTLAMALEDAAGSGCDIVLDLQAATFVDVYCLRLVLITQEVVANRGRAMVVVNAPPVFQQLVDVLEIPDLIAV
jgi:anti-anti-sigma factor